MRTIKFDIGEEVYLIDWKVSVSIAICGTCEGSGRAKALIKDKLYSVECPCCKGTKEVKTYNKVWHPIKHKFEVEYIEVGDKRGERYWIGSKDYDKLCFSEKALFSSLEEAQAECDRLNEEGEE